MDLNQSPENDPLEISPAQFQDALREGSLDAELLDVRETWELNRGILPGARHCPLSSFTQAVHTLDQGKLYVVYCEHGIRSYDAAAWLCLQGYKALSLQGGFSVWDGPTENFDASK